MDTNLLPGFRSAMQYNIAVPAPVDLNAFTTAFNVAEDKKRQRAIEDETMRIKKEQLALQADNTKAQLEIQNKQFGLQQAEFDDKVTSRVDPEVVFRGKQLDDLNTYQKNFFSIAQTVSPEQQKKLIATYNKHPLVIKFGQEVDENMKVKQKKPEMYETEISKKSAGIIDQNVKDNITGTESIRTYDETLRMIDNTPENVFGITSDLKTTAGKWLGALGIDNEFVKNAKTSSELQSQLRKNNLASLKTFLGGTGSISNAEGERINAALGEITDFKSTLKSSYKILKLKEESKQEQRNLTNLILQKSPENLGAVSLQVQKIQDFPKMIVVGNGNGKAETKTFYEYADQKRAMNPNISYVELRESWNKIYNASMGSNISFAPINSSLAEILGEM